MGQERPEILVIEVGGRRFGLAASEVVELVRVVTIVRLREAPEWVEGVVNLRGQVVPVVDLRGRLSLPRKGVELSDHLVVARVRGRVVALRVDRALDLVRPEVGPGRVAMLAGGILAPVLELDTLWTGDDWAELGRALAVSDESSAGRGGAA